MRKLQKEKEELMLAKFDLDKKYAEAMGGWQETQKKEGELGK